MIIQYLHHGTLVFVREDLKGKHRGLCLCYSCNRFKPGRPDNCPKAEKLYALCVQEGLTTPVFECPTWQEKP